MSRRGREKSVEKYIAVRISQLEEDRKKCLRDYDKQWYNRIISELHWARAEIEKDCWMEEEEEEEAPSPYIFGILEE